MAESSLTLNLTLEQLSAVVKSVSISVSVAAEKMQRFDPESRRGKIARDEYMRLSDALDELRDAEHAALIGGE